MANTVRIKRRTSGAAGAPAQLANAELAFNEVGDGVLYYGKGTGGADGTATSVIAIGGSGAFVDLTGTQTISGNKTFTGSLNFSGATIATLATTGNVTVGGDLTVNGTTTTINSTTVSTDDKNIVLADTASPSDASADGGGITLRGTTDKTIQWSSATGAWETNVDFRVTKASGDTELTVKALDTVGSDADARLIVDAGNTGEAEVSFRYQGVEKSYFSSRNDTNTLVIGGTNVDIWTGGSSTFSIQSNGNAFLFGALSLGTPLAVSEGGTGTISLTGYVKGNGTSAMTASATIPSSDISGLGTLAAQNANNVAITGGTIDGITIDGGSY